MTPPSFPESEWAIMEVLWASSPQTASEVAKVLAVTKGWAENTVRTLLGRLVEKGALAVAEEAGPPRRYVPAVRREACVKAESESFLDRVFRGAAKPLLVHFASNAELTPEEVKELKKLLDDSIKKNKNPKP
ncbi:BlaI/MecI/CopY family transcriptional regulator [Luteolibacter sp. SL250]|uniref:BlaI/MecI/CopY family transcriptional regulator n=1 Tax=Luteolibacter sp. SL250 TaxID=2995170 RepID=UPI00226EB773|nr:BlaI/MecI/CopY family transcriptional regulator [Luteolibacter sp. SL250]WAC21442.1 BlaI/MecI/CopY family transcriptional regulator [Luteolibacter sp. SL250]